MNAAHARARQRGRARATSYILWPFEPDELYFFCACSRRDLNLDWSCPRHFATLASRSSSSRAWTATRTMTGDASMRADATPSATTTATTMMTTATVPRGKAMSAEFQLVFSTLKSASNGGGDGDAEVLRTLRRAFPVLMEQHFNPTSGTRLTREMTSRVISWLGVD